jgi:thioredoxin 1
MVRLLQLFHPLSKQPNVMTSAAVLKLTSDNFADEVLQSDVPVLVDFWAEWCGPCKMLGPILDEIARDKGAAVKVCKVNIDEESGLATQFGIQSIPALFYFKAGQLAHKSVGVTPKSQIIQKLESLA